MTEKEARLPVVKLRELLRYDPESGILTWNWRSDAELKWNARWANSAAGSGVRDALYVRFTVDGATFTIGAHRVAWALHTGRWPDHLVDHEDGNPFNNRWGNLRAANHSQNMFNKTRVSGAYPFKGVLKCRNKCRAQIVVEGKPRHLGVFDDPLEAARVYDEAAIRLYGVFAKTNKQLGLI